MQINEIKRKQRQHTLNVQIVSLPAFYSSSPLRWMEAHDRASYNFHDDYDGVDDDGAGTWRCVKVLIEFIMVLNSKFA